FDMSVESDKVLQGFIESAQRRGWVRDVSVDEQTYQELDPAYNLDYKRFKLSTIMSEAGPDAVDSVLSGFAKSAKIKDLGKFSGIIAYADVAARRIYLFPAQGAVWGSLDAGKKAMMMKRLSIKAADQRIEASLLDSMAPSPVVAAAVIAESLQELADLNLIATHAAYKDDFVKTVTGNGRSALHRASGEFFTILDATEIGALISTGELIHHDIIDVSHLPVAKINGASAGRFIMHASARRTLKSLSGKELNGKFLARLQLQGDATFVLDGKVVSMEPAAIDDIDVMALGSGRARWVPAAYIKPENLASVVRSTWRSGKNVAVNLKNWFDSLARLEETASKLAAYANSMPLERYAKKDSFGRIAGPELKLTLIRSRLNEMMHQTIDPLVAERLSGNLAIWSYRNDAIAADLKTYINGASERMTPVHHSVIEHLGVYVSVVNKELSSLSAAAPHGDALDSDGLSELAFDAIERLESGELAASKDKFDTSVAALTVLLSDFEDMGFDLTDEEISFVMGKFEQFQDPKMRMRYQMQRLALSYPQNNDSVYIVAAKPAGRISVPNGDFLKDLGAFARSWSVRQNGKLHVIGAPLTVGALFDTLESHGWTIERTYASDNAAEAFAKQMPKTIWDEGRVMATLLGLSLVFVPQTESATSLAATSVSQAFSGGSLAFAAAATVVIAGIFKWLGAGRKSDLVEVEPASERSAVVLAKDNLNTPESPAHAEMGAGKTLYKVSSHIKAAWQSLAAAQRLGMKGLPGLAQLREAHALMDSSHGIKGFKNNAIENLTKAHGALHEAIKLLNHVELKTVFASNNSGDLKKRRLEDAIREVAWARDVLADLIEAMIVYHHTGGKLYSLAWPVMAMAMYPEYPALTAAALAAFAAISLFKKAAMPATGAATPWIEAVSWEKHFRYLSRVAGGSQDYIQDNLGVQWNAGLYNATAPTYGHKTVDIALFKSKLSSAFPLLPQPAGNMIVRLPDLGVLLDALKKRYRLHVILIDESHGITLTAGRRLEMLSEGQVPVRMADLLAQLPYLFELRQAPLVRMSKFMLNLIHSPLALDENGADLITEIISKSADFSNAQTYQLSNAADAEHWLAGQTAAVIKYRLIGSHWDSYDLGSTPQHDQALLEQFKIWAERQGHFGRTLAEELKGKLLKASKQVTKADISPSLPPSAENTAILASAALPRFDASGSPPPQLAASKPANPRAAGVIDSMRRRNSQRGATSLSAVVDIAAAISLAYLAYVGFAHAPEVWQELSRYLQGYNGLKIAGLAA
ncbi:MAG: hypothetical protein AABZ44_09075, partial [Elusimicrobiota bacterium]